MGPIKFFYNSKFDFTAKSLVTNTAVITRALCINIEYRMGLRIYKEIDR